MNKDSFFDENGLLHVRKGEYSENGVLFLSEYIMLSKLLGRKIFINLDPIVKDTFFDPNPAEDNGPACHF